MPEIHKVNLREKLSLIDSHWDPKIVGELNGQHVLFEPATTLNTGNVVSDRTIASPGWI